MDDELVKQFAKNLNTSDKKKDANTLLKDIEQHIRECETTSSLKQKVKPKRNATPTCSVPSSLNSGGEGDSAQANKPKLKSATWSFKDVGGFYMPELDAQKLSIHEQERILIRDLIYAFSGVPSTYVKTDCSFDELNTVDVSDVKFKISDELNASLAKLADELLPMIAYFMTIQNFVEESIMLPDCGQVRQALSAGLSDYIGQYYDLMASIETELNAGQLSMQKFVYYLRPTLNCMEAFARIVCYIRQNKINGANILNYLQEQYDKFCAEEEVLKFIQNLVGDATVPYMKIVQTWTQKGIIVDPQNDFFIVDNDQENLTNSSSSSSSSTIQPELCCADYWERRYQTLNERVPKFLVKHKQMILNTGKYLNVLRHCGIKLELDTNERLVYVPGRNDHVALLKKSYDYSAKKMLEVLRKDNNLLAHLRGIKRYMLMQNGDLVAAFLDECDEELDKNADEVEPSKVQHLFADALNNSSVKQDPYNENVQCQLLTMNLVDQLASICVDFRLDEDKAQKSEQSSEPDRLQINGYEAFTLNYIVKWPLTLVHDRGAMEKLQLVFRELFYLKHVQYHLSRLWSLKRTKYLQTSKAYSLRHRMLNTFVNIEYFMTVDVIEPNWVDFTNAVEKAENIDQVQIAYNEFIDRSLMMGLLMESSTFIHSIFTIGGICLNFCDYVEVKNQVIDHDVFDQSVDEYDKDFIEMVQAIVELLKQLVHNMPSSRCYHLLKRLEFVNAYMVHNVE